jgi:acyl-CoA reductase-like NAD-dependent aldehyde dehydrogenase
MEGQSVAAESRQMMPTWDPGKGRVFSEFASGQSEDVDRAV